MKYIAKLTSYASIAFVLSLLFTSIVTAAPGSQSLFGDAAYVQQGNESVTAVQVRSNASISPNYGGINFNIPDGLILSDLDTLQAQYNFTAGSCGGGSPRFAVDVETPTGTQTIQISIGPAPNYTQCPAGWNESGNLAASGNLVDATQLGLGFYQPYGEVQATYGTYDVTGIRLIVDSYWFAGTQTVLVDNVMINNVAYTFESANSCKNGGWQSALMPLTFSNQGQCVSYYAKGGQ